MLGAFPMSAVPMSSLTVQRTVLGGAGAFLLTGYAAILTYLDNLRLRGRDQSGGQFTVRDESEGYW
jgi:hypothetical protein